jgi:release factor glutamine methyltransferase
VRIRELIHQTAMKLADGGLEKMEAARDARLLMQHASGFDRAALISRENEPASPELVERFRAMVERRAEGEPVSRIVGEKEFFGLRFRVTPAVLDPRPETEVLVDRVLADQGDREAPTVFADIGTGSGAIAVALLANLPSARCVAVDISGDALDVAATNARANGVDERVDLVRGDFLTSLSGSFDFIVSNPPYIVREEIAMLAREVREYDPRAALDGGADGLDAYRVLLAQAGPLLKPGGRLYVEIGAGQAKAIKTLARAGGWHVIDAVTDLGGNERVLVVIAM